MKDLYTLSSYQYELPEELIAQYPCTPRDSSRLLVIDRKSGSFKEIVFRELTDFLQSGDSLVFNDTKVIPARLFGKRESGGFTEIFLVKKMSDTEWEVLSRPGRKLRVGSRVIFGDDFSCEVLETLTNGNKVVRFIFSGIFNDFVEKYGRMPLPQYIKRDVEEEIDKDRYQTIYAANPGAFAAPTAGLHFSENMLNTLIENGVDQVRITLHVGLGTFRPVQTEDIREHDMHAERFVITPEAAEKLNGRDPKKKQIVVGTTCCRALETAVDASGKVVPGNYDTNIFIYPGYQFKYVQSLLTNFHLPGSTLLMLVCAFGGYELVMEAYKKAIKDHYRFYSYGDAMLIL